MRKIENDCCDCAAPGYPCMGDSCPLRSAEHIYCDKCKDEITDCYVYDGKDYCEHCILEVLTEEGVIEHETDL